MLINSVLFGVESNSRKYIHLDNHLASVALGGAFGGFAQGIVLKFALMDKIYFWCPIVNKK